MDMGIGLIYPGLMTTVPAVRALVPAYGWFPFYPSGPVLMVQVKV